VGQFDGCFSRAFAELGSVLVKVHVLDDWQLISRIAHVIYTFVEEGKERGCDGAAAAVYYITKALDGAGIDRFKTYRAYLHGTREDVLMVLRDIFPDLVSMGPPVEIYSKRLKNENVAKQLETRSTTWSDETQHFPPPRDCFQEAFLALKDVIISYRKLEDWQFISRIITVIDKFISEGKMKSCNGMVAARYYIPLELEEAGIDRFREYRAYLHGTRTEILRILYEIFPNIVRIHRPYTIEELRRQEGLVRPFTGSTLNFRFTQPKTDESTTATFKPVSSITTTGNIKPRKRRLGGPEITIIILTILTILAYTYSWVLKLLSR